jgi:hypothetical protein
LGDVGVPTPCFVLSCSGHIEFQNNPIPVNTVIRQKERGIGSSRKNTVIYWQRFYLFLLFISQMGVQCVKNLLKAELGSDNGKTQATSNNRQPPTTTMNTGQQHPIH